MAVISDGTGHAEHRRRSRRGGRERPAVEPTVRTNFADTALWVGALQTDANGEASVQLTMPENLTTWKTRVWAMGDGTRVGEGEAEVVTSKNLIVRLQAPRFFTQKDEVVLSANVHNYLRRKKQSRGAGAGRRLPAAHRCRPPIRCRRPTPTAISKSPAPSASRPTASSAWTGA